MRPRLSLRAATMPPEPAPADADRLLDLLQRLALELAFAESGGGSRAIALIDELATACGAAAIPDALGRAAAAARAALGPPGDSGRGIDAATIARLNEWQPWMVEAVTAWQRGQPLPAAPAQWAADMAAASASPQPPVAHPTAPAAAAGGEQEVAVLPEGCDREFMLMFCAEAHELLQDVEQSTLVLETSPRDADRLNTLFRAFHTLKGNASMLKLAVLQRIAHEIESLLDLARRGKLELGRPAIDVVLQGADVIRGFVAEMERQASGSHVGRRITLPIPRVVAAVQDVIAGRTPAGTAPARAAPAPAPAPAAPVAQPAAVVAEPAPAVEPQPAPQPAAEPPAAAAPAAAAPAATPAAGGSSLVRVDTHKLDELIDLVGELVVAQSMVVQSPDLAALSNPHLARCLGQIRGITGDLQRTAMALRMVPVGGTFRKMTRLVRDISGELGKEITLRLEGEDTELDRTIVEELSDPLVHMIRNSADHGLEPPAERAAAGKPRAGTITLRAFHRGGFIVIEVSDDGRGLDADRIRRKAVERGLVRPDEPLDDAAAYDLIFMPGFSTAERVTGVSGRGVGMDVVRRNVEKIRGKIEVDSVPGKGTTFTLYVPLTLAIIEALIVGVGDQRYVIPTLSVRESFRPLPGAVTTVHGRGELVSVRGRLTPLVRLGRHLGTGAAVEEPTEGIVVVIEAGQDSRCLFVDQLLGKQEVVIKSLGEMFARHPSFAGAAILGDGRVGLILNVNSLVKMKVATGDAAA